MSIFDKTNDALGNKLDRQQFSRLERDRNSLLGAVGNDLARLIKPAMTDAMKSVLSKQVIRVEAPKVTVPTPIVNVKASDVTVPQPQVSVTVPPIKLPAFNIPDLKWPSSEMPVRGFVKLMGIDLDNPLPVQLRDANGKPVSFGDSTQAITGGGGGGIAKQVKISNDSDNPVPVILATSASTASTASALIDSSGEQYSGSNPLPVVIGSSAATSAVNVVDSTGVAYTGDNPLPVDGDFYPVTQPVSGTVVVSGVTASIAANIVDSTGEAYTGDNPLPIKGPVVVSDITSSTSVNLEDSTGVGYSGSNPVPTRVVNVRGNLKTAYVTEDEVGEVTILAGVAGEYHDLIMVMGANESDAAINVDIRATVGGTVLMTLAIPANGTAGISLPQAMPQQDIDATWTAQNNATDNSTTQYSITGLFKKEV